MKSWTKERIDSIIEISQWCFDDDPAVLGLCNIITTLFWDDVLDNEEVQIISSKLSDRVRESEFFPHLLPLTPEYYEPRLKIFREILTEVMNYENTSNFNFGNTSFNRGRI